MQIWRVNVSDHSFKQEDTPEAWSKLGGRGLIARILLDEVPPTCDSLGANNKFILAPGLLSGYGLSSLDRISAGGKSPLTGGVKESNAGGTTAAAMTQMGIKALIIEGFPSEETFQILHLSAKGLSFDPAGDLVNRGVYESAQRLRERYGNKVALAIIGPAGEMRLLASGIAHLDKDGTPSRICGRGGLESIIGQQKDQSNCYRFPRQQTNRSPFTRRYSRKPARFSLRPSWLIPKAGPIAIMARLRWCACAIA